MEITGLTEEEYALLEKQNYIIAYDVSDNAPFFLQQDADLILENKDHWLEETAALDEKTKDELDAVKKNMDAEWAEWDLEKEYTIDETYQNRMYGDTENNLNDDEVPEDSLEDIQNVLGISQEIYNEEEEELAVQKKRKKKRSQKSYYVNNNTVEESLDQNTGTKIIYDGLSSPYHNEQRSVNPVFTKGESYQNKENRGHSEGNRTNSENYVGPDINAYSASSYQAGKFHSSPADTGKTEEYKASTSFSNKEIDKTKGTFHGEGKTEIDSKYENYEKFREELHQKNAKEAQKTYYDQDRHILKNIDYSRGTKTGNGQTEQKKSQGFHSTDGFARSSAEQAYQNYYKNRSQNEDRGGKTTGRTYYGGIDRPGVYGARKEKGRLCITFDEYLMSASGARNLDAYRGYYSLSSHGGMIARGKTNIFLNQRSIAYGIYKLSEDGFTKQKILSLLKQNKILSQSMLRTLGEGDLNASDFRLIGNSLQKYFHTRYRADLSKMTKKQMQDFLQTLKNSENKMLRLYTKCRLITKYDRLSRKAFRRVKRGQRIFRREILGGLDAYDGARLMSRSLRSARALMYVSKKSSIYAGKRALKLTKRIAPASVKNKIQIGEKIINRRIQQRNRRIVQRKSKINAVKKKVKDAPKKFAGKQFRKVFKKGYQETILGRITSKISTTLNRLFNFFNNLGIFVKGMLWKAAIVFAVIMMIAIIFQAITSVGLSVVSTIQSFFETSSGKDVSETQVMKSAGGQILETLIKKDEDWLEDDVYGMASKSPSQVKESKVYGGTDPETGKKYEIKQFGVSGQEVSGVNFNFYNGDGYTGITGKVPKELLDDPSKTVKKKKNSNEKKDVSSGFLKFPTVYAADKKTSSETTYKGDEVIFANKGKENDGIPKKFVGNYRTTGYCAGCNSPAGSRATSSGVAASPGITIAIREDIRRKTGGSDGSIYYMNGHYYILQDKCGTDAIDIYVSNAKTCAGTLESAVTAKNVKTYLVSAKASKPQNIKLNGKTYTGVSITDNGKKKWLLFDGTVDIITGSGGLGVSGIDLPTSNAKAIFSMGTVYFDQTGYYQDDLLKKYCMELWNASHKVKGEVSDVYQCEGCKKIKNYKCNDPKIENAKGPNGRSYGLLDGIHVHKDSYGDKGCKKYYCNEDKNSWQKYKYKKQGCKGTVNKRGASKSAELTIEEIKQYPKAASGEKISKGKGKIDGKQIVEVTAAELSKAQNIDGYKAKCSIVEIYTESSCPGHYGCEGKHSKKYCPGHVDLNVNACIVGIEDTEAVKLYQIDPGDKTSKMNEYDSSMKGYKMSSLNWKHWTKENRDRVDLFYDDDWKETYGIDIASLEQQITGISSSGSSSTLSAAERKKILNSLPKNLSEKRRKVVEWAIDAVGRIPYHYQDVASYPGYEKNHFGSKSWPDHKGRNKKGLDCAKFVDWVYWSTVNNNLGNGPTATLRGLGKETNQLKPGDIVVRGTTTSGTTAHTGIFIGYNSKNQMVYVHESSSGSGNVKVSAGNAFEKKGSNGSVTWRNMDYLLK